jgi:hypothetical protein
MLFFGRPKPGYAWKLLLPCEGDLGAALDAVYHPDDAHKLRCLLVQLERAASPAPGLATVLFVKEVEEMYRLWCNTLTRLPERGDRIQWVPEVVELPGIRSGMVDRIESQLVRTRCGWWVDPRNIVWLGKGNEMGIEFALWWALVRPPVFKPADLSMQFESAARERSKYRAHIDQVEGARNARP